MRTGLIAVALLLVSCSAVPPDDARDSAATVPPSEGLTITGVVTSEGVECPAVRADDGQLYTIAGGQRELLRPGARVRIIGSVAQMSFCMQGTTINATKIEVLAESR